jgi:hypothetical protein
MLEFLAEALPGPSLLPEAPYDRYRARAWGQFLGLPAGSFHERARLRAPSGSELARMDVTEVRRGVERIEPIERRNAWLAVIDGAYDENATTTFRERLSSRSGASNRRWRRRRGSRALSTPSPTSTPMRWSIRCVSSRLRSSTRSRHRASSSGWIASRRDRRPVPRGLARVAPIRGPRSCQASNRRAGADSGSERDQLPPRTRLICSSRRR